MCQPALHAAKATRGPGAACALHARQDYKLDFARNFKPVHPGGSGTVEPNFPRSEFTVFCLSSFSEICQADCWRSESRMPTIGWSWSYSANANGSDRVDAIDFQIDSDTILSGYRLWGVKSVNSATFLVTMSLYREHSLIASKTGTYPTNSSVKTFEVHFSQEITISPNITYTAAVRIVTSAHSYAHNDGMVSASCSGVSVIFTTSSMDSNASSQQYGQIPSLILLSKGSRAKR